MDRIGPRQLLVALLFVASMPLSWWLFGWKMVDEEGIGLVTYRRSFGRTTVRAVDGNRDGRIDGRYFYRWWEPVTVPGSRPVRWEEDRDGDGRMDVWVTYLGVNDAGEEEWRYRADTDRNGEPDWSFKTLDPLSGDQAVSEMRGW
ncbi:MAG: hypothetical protein PVF68_04190 [Acidobacteriota bacterium]|jgi:hypothetical protein